MPFKSKKQKKTIDAAAHNPTFAKKVGVKVSDAKKMSAHGKGQTKFQEATDTVEKDEKGNVKIWKHEGDWKKSTEKKDPRGKVTHASDVARRKTEKMSKPEKEMAEAFEKAISEVKVTSGPNKGKEWSPKTPGPTNKNYKPFDKNGVPSPDDGATAPPPGYKAPKSTKKAEIEQPTQVAATGDDETIAETKKKPSKIKVAMKNNKIKALRENIKLVSQLLSEAKKAGLKGDQKKLDVAEPKGKLTGADFKALKGKKKTEEAVDQNKDGKNDFEDVKIARMKAALKGKSKKVSEASDEKCNHTPKGKKCPIHGLKECGMYEGKDVYMESLYLKLVNQLKG